MKVLKWASIILVPIFLGLVVIGIGLYKYGSSGESTDATEFSVLQSLEYDYRTKNHDLPFIVFKKALGTNSTVVAFPISNEPQGYVVILAQAEGKENVKSMPSADFKVTSSSYAAVKSQVNFSKEVDQFIVEHIK